MSTQIVQGLFQPMPHPCEVETTKGFLDHCAQYLNSSEGVRDAFDAISHLAFTCELLNSPFSKEGRLAHEIKGLFESAGLALSFPQLIYYANGLNHSFSHLFNAQYDHTVRLARAVKDVFMDGLLLINAAARATLFAEGAEILLLSARQVFRLNVVLSATALLTDGSDLIRDCLEWQVKGKLPEEDNLAFLNVVKNASSVAVSALLLVSYAFRIALSDPLMIASFFTLSTFYLVSKVAGYFYEKMIVDPQLQARPLSLRTILPASLERMS